MRLEYYPLEKLKQEILVILGKHLDISPYQVFFLRVAGGRLRSRTLDIV